MLGRRVLVAIAFQPPVTDSSLAFQDMRLLELVYELPRPFPGLFSLTAFVVGDSLGKAAGHVGAFYTIHGINASGYRFGVAGWLGCSFAVTGFAWGECSSDATGDCCWAYAEV